MSNSYTVQSGDSPALIAHKLTGDIRRASDLIASNPHKPTTRIGLSGVPTFQSIGVGEVLQLPAHWSRYAQTGVGASFINIDNPNNLGSVTAANALALFLSTNGCDCSLQQCLLTKAFEIAYNADVAGGVWPGPSLVVDAKFGTADATAFAQVANGFQPPAVCFSTGGICANNPTADANALAAMGGTPAPAPSPPAPAPTPAPIIVPPNPPANQTTNITTGSNVMPWVIGGIAVAAGAAFVAWRSYSQKHGSSMGGASLVPVTHRLPPARRAVRRRGRR